jgi:hypothetical protein
MLSQGSAVESREMTAAFDLYGVDGRRLRDIGLGVHGGEERSIESSYSMFAGL